MIEATRDDERHSATNEMAVLSSAGAEMMHCSAMVLSAKG
jgi:hypothetical protein